MPLSYSQFAQRTIESGLISRDDLIAFDTSLEEQERAESGDQLARLLVKHKRLTAFQAESIYRGKGKALVLGNYVLLDKLGQGGMGAVYKAKHQRMQRIVALKVVTPDVVQSDEALKRFQREVQAAAKLEHQNIVTAFDADFAEGTHFLVMQFVEGRDLSSEVKEQGPLSIDRAIDCILQAAQGLEYVHSRGVVHRDIKPGNLMLGNDGILKILDMGLARVEDPANADKDASLTATGTLMGTVDYMSPEQALDTKQADARSDIYSLGCTFFFVLTGRPPYRAETIMKRLVAHRESPIPQLVPAHPSPSRMADQQTIQSIFERMVAKRPEDRYQNMGELIRDLQACQSGSFIQKGRNLVRTQSEDERLAQFLSGFTASGSDGDREAEHDHVAVRTPGGSDSGSGHRRTVSTASRAADTDSGMIHLHHRARTGIDTAEELIPVNLDIGNALSRHRHKPSALNQSLKGLMDALKTPLGWASAGVILIALILFFVALLMRESPTGMLVLNISQPDLAGGVVRINGQERLTIRSIGDTLPIIVYGVGSDHEVQVTKPGYRTFSRRFQFQQGETVRFAVQLERTPTATEAAERDPRRSLDWNIPPPE